MKGLWPPAQCLLSESAKDWLAWLKASPWGSRGLNPTHPWLASPHSITVDFWSVPSVLSVLQSTLCCGLNWVPPHTHRLSSNLRVSQTVPTFGERAFDEGIRLK